MGDSCCRIEKMANGYEVELRDPEIIKANNKRDSSKSGYTPYRDPWVSHVFTDLDAVLKFLKVNLPKSVSGDEYESSFDAAVAAPSDD